MENAKLKIIRDEIIEFISEVNLSSDFDIIDRFEIMRNINNFLDPDKYDENIAVLNKHLK